MPKDIPLLVKKSDSEDDIRMDQEHVSDSEEEYVSLTSEQKEELIDKLEIPIAVQPLNEEQSNFFKSVNDSTVRKNNYK